MGSILGDDDEKWIHQNVFIQETVSKAWVARAKELRGERDGKANGNLVESGSQRWFSVLAEYWTGWYFKGSLEDQNKGDWRSKHDFLHLLTRKKFDVKTNAGVTRFEDLSGCSYFYDQESMFKGYDGFIFSYYDLKQDILTLIGWLLTEEFRQREVVAKGKKVDFGNGRGFTASMDTRLVPWEYLYPLTFLDGFSGKLPQFTLKDRT